MELIKHFAGASLNRVTLENANDRVRAYAARNAHSGLVIVINKSDQPAAMRTTLHHAHRQWLLTGPAIDAKQGVTLTESSATALHKGTLQVPAYSAILLET
jgi:ABC-type cobalamin transport system ATPase subunit